MAADWQLNRNRLAFLDALRRLAPGTVDWLREMFLRLHQRDKSGDGRAQRLLAEAWARRFGLTDPAEPDRPLPWVVSVAAWNLQRWHEEMEDEGEDEALLRLLVTGNAGAGIRPSPSLKFELPWIFDEPDEPEVELVYTPEWRPGETREQARARIMAELERWVDEWLDQQERT